MQVMETFHLFPKDCRKPPSNDDLRFPRGHAGPCTPPLSGHKLCPLWALTVLHPHAPGSIQYFCSFILQCMPWTRACKHTDFSPILIGFLLISPLHPLPSLFPHQHTGHLGPGHSLALSLHLGVLAHLCSHIPHRMPTTHSLDLSPLYVVGSLPTTPLHISPTFFVAANCPFSWPS
jgi:hypothetical protein